MTLYAGCVQVEGSFEFGDSRDRVKHFAFDYCYDSAVDRSDNAEYASQELVSTLGEAGQAFVGGGGGGGGIAQWLERRTRD